MGEFISKISRMAAAIAAAIVCALSAQADDFVIVLDAGHGGSDAGASGPGCCERDINLNVTNMVGEILTRRIPSATIYYTQTEGKTIKVNQRAADANRHKGSLMVSIHCDSHDTDTTLVGASVLVPDHKISSVDNPQSKLDRSNTLASCILKRLTSDAGRRSRGIILRDDLPVLTATDMPAALVEMDYINNPVQAAFLNSAEGQRKLSEAIANGIVDYAKGIGVTVTDGGATTDPGGTIIAQPAGSESSGRAYKIQILTSRQPLEAGDPRLKGLWPVDCYQEKGLYKYTCGEFATIAQAKAKLKDIQKLFSDAFIIETQDGVRIR